MNAPSNPLELFRTRSYLVLLALATVVRVPISAAAFGFLALVAQLQQWIFTDLPKALGLGPEPLWWPLPLLAVAGVLAR